jgi:hypothetical protein
VAIATALLNGPQPPHVDSKDSEQGDTALILASRWKRLEVVRLLLDHRADINARNKIGRTPLMFAARAGCREGVEVRWLCGSWALSDGTITRKMMMMMIVRLPPVCWSAAAGPWGGRDHPGRGPHGRVMGGRRRD